jgi:5'-nucleotidase / UDP-sugar diphosphatase
MLLRPLLLTPLLAALGAGGAQAFTLHILHFNDFHSRIESINAFESTCSGEDEEAGECFGGAARLVTAIEDLRAGIGPDEGVLVLNAGDSFQGSLFFTAYEGAAEAEMLNRMGLDAMVYGNHEFDLGPEPLAKFVEAAEFPVISGSVDVSADNLLAPLALDHLVVESGGEKVAILGVTTPETVEIASPGPSIAFRDPAEYLKGKVAEIEGEGIDKIVVLSHSGVGADQRLAAEVPGVDVIVGGHSHTLFSNTDEEAGFKYPVMVNGPGGGPAVPVVQAGAYSKYLGHLAIVFDADGEVTEATGDTLLLDKSVTPDAATLERIKELAGPIEELKAREVAEIAGGIDGSRETCRAEECQMGTLVADAMLDRVKSQGVTIAITNGGGLRASIGGGMVTMGDVLAVLPFQNTLSTFNISGSGIIAALENGVSQVEEGAGRFPQVAGLRFTWDPGQPAMSRIKSVEVADGDGWKAIDPAATYTVATNNFMRNGGDGYTVLRDEGTNAYDFGPGLEDVLADYLAANQGYAPYTDGRISRVE